jgi:SAM-dependent methyltransferase
MRLATVISFPHLSALRQAEIEDIALLIPPGSVMLEIGAGTGEQARFLAHRGFAVSAIDMPQSNYADRRGFPILDYDGLHIPFPDASFDVVYSSNVLEHVVDLDGLEREILRVLRPTGFCIHLIPSTAWRLWTSLATVPNVLRFFLRACGVTLALRRDELPYGRRVGRAWWRFLGRIWEMVRQPRHGEQGNALTEMIQFGRAWWRRHFGSSGFEVSEARPAGLFYTGHMILGSSLAIPTRRRLAHVLGSACNLYVLQPMAPSRSSAMQQAGAGTTANNAGHGWNCVKRRGAETRFALALGQAIGYLWLGRPSE